MRISGFDTKTPQNQRKSLPSSQIIPPSYCVNGRVLQPIISQKPYLDTYHLKRPNFESVAKVFKGSMQEAQSKFAPIFAAVANDHVHDKFRILDDYLMFIKRGDRIHDKPIDVQNDFTINSHFHAQQPGANGCCIAAAYDFVNKLDGYGNIYGEFKTYHNGHVIPNYYEHVGAFIVFENPDDPPDSGVILFDEFDNTCLVLKKNQPVESNGLTISLDATGSVVTRKYEKHNFTSTSNIYIKNLINPDETVGDYYLFRNQAKVCEFFIRRKDKGFVNLNFEKRTLLMRDGHRFNNNDLILTFDEIKQTDFCHVSQSSHQVNRRFTLEYYSNFNYTKEQFWYQVKHFIEQQAIIRLFFPFPKDIANI